MRLDLRSFAVITLSLLLGLPQAGAWNSVGHMTVAYVAYQQLTPQQQTRVMALLALNPNYNKWKSNIKPGTDPKLQNRLIFAMAATWPDEIRATGSGYKLDGETPPSTPEAAANIGYKDMNQHDYWHFINQPFSMDGTALPRTSVPNVMTQFRVMRLALASDESDALKSYDLVWLMHLVGDFHQPMRTSMRVTKDAPQGDGNSSSIALSGKAHDLRAYWDNLLGVGGTADYPLAVQAAGLLQPPDPAAVADLNSIHWLNESQEVAFSHGYAAPIGAQTRPAKPYTIEDGSPYAQHALEDAQVRVALAGARLARLLNAELK